LDGSGNPKKPEVRTATELSAEEKQWLYKRRPVAGNAMRDWLKRINIAGFDSDNYMSSVLNTLNQPTIGIAASGGGYRALLNGAGAIAAFDDRTRGSKEKGHLGGLLQATTYLAGLSGGGWLVGSLFANNFTSVQDIVDQTNAGHGYLWDFDRSILQGPPDEGIKKFFKRLSHWKDIHSEIEDKKHAGYNSSITDYWGRGLSFQLINATDGGACEFAVPWRKD
jgi:lysophospholipase